MKKKPEVKPKMEPPKKSSISLHLPESTVTLLKWYLKIHGHMYGIEPDQDSITNGIFLSFFYSDREFMAYVMEKEGSELLTKHVKYK